MCRANRLQENSFQERRSYYKGIQRCWNILRTLNCSLYQMPRTTLWNTCERPLHEGDILNLINQDVTYIAYLNIHIATLRNTNLKNKYSNALAPVTPFWPRCYYWKWWNGNKTEIHHPFPVLFLFCSFFHDPCSLPVPCPRWPPSSKDPSLFN